MSQPHDDICISCGSPFLYKGRGFHKCKPCMVEQMARARNAPRKEKKPEPKLKLSSNPEVNHRGYELLLFKKHSCGYDGRRQSWYIRYKVRKKGEQKFQIERKWIDAANEDEAVAEKDRFYTAALMRGAGWWAGAAEPGNRSKRTIREGFRTKKRKIADKDQYISTYTAIVVRYVVVVAGKTVKKGLDSVVEARRVRDEYLMGGDTLKLCACCKKKPVWIIGSKTTGTATLVHEEEGCPNKFRISDKAMDTVTKVKAWNLRFASGERQGWGIVTAQHVFDLGVFDHIVAGRTRGGPKRKVKEEEVFDDIEGLFV